MIAFYCTMFVENTLLACVSLLAHRGETFVYTSLCFWIVWGGFAFGLFAMALYYQCFHIRYIKLSLLASNFDFLSNSNGHNKRQLPNSLPRNQSVNLNQLSPRQTNSSSGLLPPGSNGMMTGIPGVFNCRLNPALKRKKKKPSSFVPRPPEPPSVPENRTATTDRRAEGRAIRENQFVSSSLNPVPAPSRNLQSWESVISRKKLLLIEREIKNECWCILVHTLTLIQIAQNKRSDVFEPKESDGEKSKEKKEEIEGEMDRRKGGECPSKAHLGFVHQWTFTQTHPVRFAFPSTRHDLQCSCYLPLPST